MGVLLLAFGSGMKKKSIQTKITKHPHYIEKKPFFSPKEIIFRSNGRARVLYISPKMQILLLTFFCLFAVWSFYSYHFYARSGSIIHRKDLELVMAKDAYVDLISDFMALHQNVDKILSHKENSKEIEDYKKKATVFEDKVKQITDAPGLVSEKALDKKKEISEVLLQRDVVVSERDELKKQINMMEDTLQEIKNAQLDVFERLRVLSSKEVDKLRSTFNEINVPLKKHGLYFNPLANKKESKGGLYIPAKSALDDKRIDDKIIAIYKNVDDYEYYKKIMKGLPLGKPVWSYWVTSQYGTRSDPFKKSKATHKGVDLASRTGNKIQVKAPGKVVRATFVNGYGNMVEVDHGNGFLTKYAHMNKIYVKKGQTVKLNEVIGEVGSTGRSTGPHLHYEVVYHGVSVNPMPFIKAKAS
ncbi:MAG: peptidoglycan DD-metalloendopeptidase family protein [Alphaproteobacteria bacterium]|nr:peptidoglycan DD-metalloendopeptidase family protein [Alphaproteobacteria bacterium]